MVGSMGLWDTGMQAWLIVLTLIVAGLGMDFAHSQGATGVSLVVRKVPPIPPSSRLGASRK